jgi:SAM-dependent methyltransferase
MAEAFYYTDAGGRTTIRPVLRPSSHQRTTIQPGCGVCGMTPHAYLEHYFHCDHCDYWFSNLEPRVEDTTAADSEYELVSYEHTRTRNYCTILDTLRKWYGAGSSLLEIGCADGLFLKLAKDRNQYECVGIEPNTKMIAGNVHRQDIRLGFFPQALELEQEDYDMIVLNCVLEHIDNLPSMILDFKSFLAPGGTIAINVPVATGLVFRASRFLGRMGITYPFKRIWQEGFVSPHMSFFSSASIEKLFRKHGLPVVLERPLALFSLGGIFARLSVDPSIRFFQKLYIATGLYLYYPASRLFPDSKVFFIQRP